ncbi:CRISPR-associated helicase Cas3' [Arthrobacter sp.]|uniref:CRISPR-associated helicase Cas3' n=1 Tax=Arthrobacter sp. TaxID=1667 RepID=UPI0026DFF50A|nr:CRISPR-associated helicase Cas3' [Arthrobacter sp.]MDO5752436.1 CRISPR-associated helicase Cas3' [Arthrobacter sp.]
MALWSKRHGLGEAYPLISHLLDTAASATVLWDHWLRAGLRAHIEDSLGPGARAQVAAAAGLHDIGKANPVFAGQLLARTQEPWHGVTRKALVAEGYSLDVPAERLGQLRRHEKVSALSLALGDLDFGDCASAEWLAVSALGHHGRFECPTSSEARAFTKSAGGAWKLSRDKLRSDVLAACGLDPEGVFPQAPPDVAILIAGLVVLADRTASELQAVQQAQKDMDQGLLDINDPEKWMAVRREFFATRLPDTLGLYKDFKNARTSIAGNYELRPLQEAALFSGGGLWIAMAPTGNGKTEAALLRHAQENERLIFALPTQATTNAMMKRIQKAYQGTGNVAELAHRLATVEDFYAETSEHDTAGCGGSCTEHEDHKGSPCEGGLIPSEFLRNGTARLLAPVSVATIDQVLAGSLRTKWAHLRLLTLANAHIVIDEAHLMDQYQSALAEQLMKWWGATGTRVTLLSATLPQWQRDRFAQAYSADWQPEPISFPSHEHVPGRPETMGQPSYSISVKTIEAKNPVHAHLTWAAAMKAAAPNARLGLVVNTVRRAQETARGLQGLGLHPIVLHSRMTAGHRRDAADRLLTEIGRGGTGAGTVVVGTQAIEASLDIDLDAMSTDLAPAPSIIQRAGRVWRHEDPHRPARLPGICELPLQIVRGTGKYGALPYFVSELDRVEKYLTSRERLHMPEDSQAFVEASALRLDEVDWTEQEEISEYARRFAKADGVVINASEIINPDTDLEFFMRLTGHDVDEQTATRLIEPPSVTVLIIDPAAGHGAPGAWTGSIRDLETITPRDRDQLRKAMEASVPLNGALARRVLELGIFWAPQTRSLQNMIPVVLGQAGIGYDALLGVVDMDAR